MKVDDRPLGMPITPESRFSCLGREAYSEISSGTNKFILAKKPLAFSQSLLTSPANPKSAGLTLPSPLAPQKGKQ